MATTPSFDLTEFLLPSGNNVNHLHAIPLPLDVIPGTPASSRSKRTAAINNAHDERRLPFHIAYEPLLPSRMINALRVILQQSMPVDPDRVGLSWKHGYKEFENKLSTTGAESELKDLSYELGKMATICVDRIASPKLAVVKPEHKSKDTIVTTDHAILWKPHNGTYPPLVLIEDKSLVVMGAHLSGLLNMRCDLFQSTTQFSYTGAPSIVAKVIDFL
jgi:hypothetical protein